MATFSELGIPFRLFEASVEEAEEYVGEDVCTLCSQRGHCFQLGIGDDFVASCPGCGEPAAVRADEEATPCSSCNAAMDAPCEDREPRVCYGCLRAGKAALTKDTELGMIRWQDAREGKTHGRPEQMPRMPVADPYGGVVEVPAGPQRWYRHALTREEMFELLRTPRFTTWQGETWLFENGRAMTYVGRWTKADFQRAAQNEPALEMFMRVVDGAAESVWESYGDEIGVYVFRGPSGRLRATWDMD